MYKVIKAFTDLQDNRHAYIAGNPFPRKGLTVTEERLAELSTNANRRGEPLIKLVATKGAKPKEKDEAKKETEAGKK